VHQHDGSGIYKLKLDQGKKWSTHEPLRKGMSEIRSLVDAQHEAIHSGRLKPADYARLGTQIEAQVAFIVQNCKLSPEADANLHGVLGEMLERVEAMKGKEQKSLRAGAGKVVAALNDYGKYFAIPAGSGSEGVRRPGRQALSMVMTRMCRKHKLIISLLI